MENKSYGHPSYQLILIFILSIGITIHHSVKAQVSEINPSFHPEIKITIDGVLNEEIWQQVEPISDFTQFTPIPGEKSLRKSNIYIIFGKFDLYIGAVFFDNPEELEKTLGRRDEYNHADWFLLSIDSYLNKRNAYTFGVSIGGIQLDGQLNKPLAEGGSIISGIDYSWDAVWYSSTKISREGWTAEIKIPYSMLRFSRDENQIWGIHFSRRIARLGEISEWPFIPISDRSNFVAHFGHLTNINIKPKAEFQIRPYVLARLDTYENPEVPGRAAYSREFEIGGDIKLGIGPNVKADVTINPDFGQVESDPAVLNLTAFETQLLENRPFFMESSEVFKFGIGKSQVFHSRRIGADDPILGAAKISGRSGKGLSFGVLGALTGYEINTSNNYGISRFSQQIGRYSSAGAVLTWYHSPVIHGKGWETMTGGFDWDLRFGNNNFGFEGIAVLASRESLIASRANENGHMAGIVFRKRKGSFTGHLTFLEFSDRYNPNDMGWTTNERDFRNVWINTTYNIKNGNSFGPFQRASISTYNTQRVSYAKWLNIGDINSISSEFVTRSYQTIKLSGRFSDIFGGYDLFETRGLIHWARPSNINLTGQFISDSRRTWKFSQEGIYSFYSNGGKLYGLKFDGRIDVSTKFFISANATLNLENNVLAWVNNEAFYHSSGSWYIGSGSDITKISNPEYFLPFDDRGLLEPILTEVTPIVPGVYYVPIFGNRNTRLLDLTLRSTLTLTKNLSMQFYNQLLLAKGKYEKFQILQNPEKLSELDSYPKKSEFTLNSLTTNMVVRWEYRPGSTLYFIWSHGRLGKDQINPFSPWVNYPYQTRLNEQIVDVVNTFPQNSLIVKLSYNFLN